MSTRPRLGFFLVITLLALASGAMLFRQYQETLALGAELESARSQAEELRRLRAENQRLLARQIPVAELEQLRADHAALPRLRAELEAMTKE